MHSFKSASSFGDSVPDYFDGEKGKFQSKLYLVDSNKKLNDSLTSEEKIKTQTEQVNLNILKLNFGLEN